MKFGLEYFPFDVDFFDDEKIQFISARFGLKGEIITVKLLTRIYRNGYFIEWNNDTCLLLAKNCGDGINGNLINDIVEELVKRDFFDKIIFNSFKILTSNGIQKRFFEIAKRRKEITVIEEYLVPGFEKLHYANILKKNVNNPVKNVDIEGTSKGSKVKEVKEGKEGTAAPPPAKTFKNFSEQDFIEEIKKFSGRFEKSLLNNFFAYWKELSPGAKMRFQLEKTWQTDLRLEKWKANQIKFSHGTDNKNANSAKHGPKNASAYQLLSEVERELGFE